MRSSTQAEVETFRCMARSSLVFILLGLMVVAFGRIGTADPLQMSDEALVDRLLGGGLNLYFRHVATDWTQSDNVREAGDWLSCDPARMRQLSDSGRADARAVGKAMRELKIPVSEVLASPYCRTVETARLMDLGKVMHSTEVMNLRAAGYFGGRAAIVASAQRLLATPPAPGANRVIVAHGNVAREATPVYPGEGEGIAFHPDGNGGFQVVARIPPERWVQLSASLADQAGK